jgi:hypothetical protein
MRFHPCGLAFPFTFLLLAGCGGGGAGTPQAGGGSSGGVGGSTTNLGPLSLTTLGAGNLQLIGSTDSTIIGVAGANITSVVLAPSPSPNNTRIAFSRNGTLVTMDPNGGNQTELTSDLVYSSAAIHPGWSSGGSMIAFARVASSGYSGINTISVNGTGQRRLSPATANDYWPSWSPSGKILFYNYGGTGFRIWTMNSDGTGRLPITNGLQNDLNPTFSWDGSKIAFMRYSGSRNVPYIMSATGASPHPLFSPGTEPLGNLDAPAWSPDGTKLAFAITSGTTSSVFVAPSDGSNTQQIITGTVGSDFYPSWSPDGKTLVLAASPSSTGIFGILRVTVNSTGVQQLTTGTLSGDVTPAWSPFPSRRLIVGTGAPLGNTASGFLVGQQGTGVSSLVSFACKTPATATATLQAGGNGQSNSVFRVKGDSVISLKYMNGVFDVTTSPIVSTAPAGGALVSFDNQTGTVVLVIPFSPAAPSTMAAPKIASGVAAFRGSFNGVWDKKGKNLAPGGAHEVLFDAKSGRLMSFN